MSERYARRLKSELGIHARTRTGKSIRSMKQRARNPERLEDRMLLAVGPQLVSIQPNFGDVLTDGVIRNVAPDELNFVFDESQVIDGGTLDGIRLTRAGFDDVFDGVSDVLVQPGFVGVNPDRPNEVVMRFAEALPDDLYRIEVFAVDNTLLGFTALRNVAGDAFQPSNIGADRTTIGFELNLGAQVLAVVPQPVRRQPDGSLVQARDQIEVHFNDDDLDLDSATNPAFYRLIFTADTVTNVDDEVHTPTSVSYDPSEDLAILTFAAPIEELDSGPGTYRLRIGSDQAAPAAPEFEVVENDPGSSFDTAHSLGTLAGSLVVSAEIEPVDYPLQYPGDVDEPGHRDIAEVETHLLGEADQEPGITIQPYNFKSFYGLDPEGNPLLNLITAEQRQRAREIFELYGFYLGVQFQETPSDGFTIVTGDMRALDPTIDTGPGGTIGLAGFVPNPADPMDLWPTAIMDNAELWDDKYGETADPGRLSWFETAMHEIGHLLGLGHTYELPQRTVMGDEPELAFTNIPEPVFPGDNDLIHGRFLHRPESNDIDLYSFELVEPGVFTAEIIAERLTDTSQLDAVVTLYRATDTVPELIARNDDYFSEDSFVGLSLQPGQYFLAVTSTGNVDFDPTIENTGSGGTSQGVYDVRLDFQPRFKNFLVDDTGVLIDGDADGRPGGQFNYWFRALESSQTVFVDKAAEDGGDGTLAAPYNRLDDAIAAAAALNGEKVIRAVGNGGADGDISTVGDNRAYELGINDGNVLSDGIGVQLPRNTTLMIDGGAIFKMLKSNIQVGSSSVTIDRSRSALQVLGTPTTPVIFTSYDDEQTGVDTNLRRTEPDPGDWGGLIFSNSVDRGEGRFDYEQAGIFLNYVNQADLRYGGGNVTLDSVQQVVNPIHMIDARPTISYNKIRFSADAAMSANPDSFEETTYNAPDSLGIDYQAVPFTSGYDRIGPDLRGNRLVENSINGFFIRIATPAGQQLETMTVNGRWDDKDVVHVVSENLVISGTPGGPRMNPATGQLEARTDASLKIDPSINVKLDGSRIEATVGAQLLAEGVVGQRVIFTSLLDDRYGAGGTFRTSKPIGNLQDPPAPGDWGGIYIGPAARGSMDYALVAYGGGLTRVEGSFSGFNAIEVHQGVFRLTNSTLEDNKNGRGGQGEPTREGRARNGEGAIFVRGAQPIIVNNIIKGTRGDVAGVISINVNSLNHFLLEDYGRSTGLIERFDTLVDNRGPLIRLNRLQDNSINGMVIRGATLTTESVWDDTDMVHVVFGEIVTPDVHTFGGLRLESSPTESLVVKFGGPNAGLKATGRPLDIDDRLGGSLQVVGQPGRPVVLTALADDSVGAGFDPSGNPQTDTDGFRRAEPVQPPGSFQLDLNLGPTIRELPHYVEAIELAARFWERWVEDPITVTLDIQVDFTLNDGTLGFAQPDNVVFDWDTVRQAMIDDSRAHETITQQLPLFTDASFTLPDDPANPFSVSRLMTMSRANAKALGLDISGFPGVASQYDPSEIRDGQITFAGNPFLIAASGDPSFFDFDRTDDILPGFVDFVGVAVHEIGHSLGFLSSVDTVDGAMSNPAGQRVIELQPMDMYRFEPGDGYRDFTFGARVLDPRLDQVFNDGGTYDPFGLPMPGLRPGDIPFSTGTNNGDGGQASHWKDLPQTLGIMDPTAPNGEAWFFEADKTAFDLIGWDVVGGPVAGDWRGVSLEQNSSDRNVGVITEFEDPALPAPGNNATPARAQVLGVLGQGENDNDETLRLGFDVHGLISDPSDVDVFSFDASAGTEVWLDIDRTSSNFDTVVELIDANGLVLARSDNSYAEGLGLESRYAADGMQVFGLQKSLQFERDLYSQNLLDAGMRLVLPGVAGVRGTYHVRVRSSSDDVDVVSGGLTDGTYQLQIRLSEVDEFPGSTVQFADIRHAMTGVRVRGVPQHSPLTGEVAEDVWYDAAGRAIDNNDALPMPDNSRTFIRPVLDLGPDTPIPTLYIDSFQDAQWVGNVFETDRGTISISGKLDDNVRFETGLPDSVDWYLFEVRYSSIQQPGGNTAELVFDLDYADGLTRADTTISIYDVDWVPSTTLTSFGVELGPGPLIYSNQRGGGPEDRPAPLQGTDLDDLSRGSVGPLDPFVGPIALAEGYYLLQVSSAQVQPLEFQQYTDQLPANPWIRTEPIESIFRIAEDRTLQPITDPGQGTTFDPPQVPSLLTPASAVPFHLGDVELFVSNSTSIFSVDGFTGLQEVPFGAMAGIDGSAGTAPAIGDFALRDNPLFDPTSTDLNVARAQRLHAFANDLGTGAPPTDAATGNYVWIDITDSRMPVGSVSARGVGQGGALTDDGVLTYGPDPNSQDPTMPDAIPVDTGTFYDAITFDGASLDIGIGYAIGRRDGVDNILFRFDAATGQVISATGNEQVEAERLPVPNPVPDPAAPLPMRKPNAGTNVFEQGVLDVTDQGNVEFGRLTGITFIGGTLYAVSDAGGLYTITNYATTDPTAGPAMANYLTTVMTPPDDDGLQEPVAFAGLTTGPQNVEGGIFREVLFGIDQSGNLYAINLEDDPDAGLAVGDLLPVFVDGQMTVATGVRGATGIEFGTLDQNLWHVTNQRGGDPGHGRLIPSPQGGGLSFYFGEDLNPGGGTARNYDFLGGARGSLVTDPFSMQGYGTVHDPFLYFTYFLTTEEAFRDPADSSPRDTFRVFISDESRPDGRGQWHLLASNQPAETGLGGLDVDPMDDILIDVQPLFDNSFQDVPFLMGGRNGNRDPFPYPDDDTLRPFDPGGTAWQNWDPTYNETNGVWRQARIPLGNFAGSDKLRLRFDFSTAGSFDVGLTAGVELHALAGSELRDGDTFTIDGMPFEFDLGYTLRTRSGTSQVDGETISIQDVDGVTVTYEMTLSGTASGTNIPVPYMLTETASEIAANLAAAIDANGPPMVITHLTDARINLEGAVSVVDSSPEGIAVEGAVGTTVGIPVVINGGMDATEVAEAMVQPLADTFAGGLTDAIKQNDFRINVIGHTVDDPGPLGLTPALPGDILGNFATALRARNTPPNNGRNDERLYAFADDEFNFTIPFEGVYVDDLVIGFAAYGEAQFDLRPTVPDPDLFATEAGTVGQIIPPPAAIATGEYQIEIRRGADFASGFAPNRTFDPRDRFSQVASLVIPLPADLRDGQSFTVGDGVETVTFEFEDVLIADGVAPGNLAIPFDFTESAPAVVERIRDAINILFISEQLEVSAASSNGAAVGPVGGTNRVDLFGTTVVVGGEIESLVFDTEGGSNRFRDQGQIVVASNTITNSALFGVAVDAGLRDLPCNTGALADPIPNFCSFPGFDFADEIDHAQGTAADYVPHIGPVRNLREVNQDQLAPGVVVANNVVAYGGEGGIHFRGDPGGEVIIGNVGAPEPDGEVWNDGDLHYIVVITDFHGTTQWFEFEGPGDTILPFIDQPIEWDFTNDCPGIHVLDPCGPRYSPGNPDLTEGFMIAIGRSKLDVTLYRSKLDEFYAEGVADIQSVIVRGNPTSVSFSGDQWFYPFHHKPADATVPFGRIVNNTIVGLGGTLEGDNLYQPDDFRDAGVLVEDNADPTLLNNVVVNFNTGVKVDLTSTTTILGGNLFQGNVDNARNIDVGDFAIELPSDQPLFVDRDRGNFYPAPLSRIIDSSVDSLEDRTELVTVKEPLDLARSPILAPDFDVLGQLRIDDPRVEPPDGFGKNVFKDRGAIDRVDFLGPTASFQHPVDNDVNGVDRDPARDAIRIEGQTLTRFVIQLSDLGEASAPTGTGIDDASVSLDSVVLLRDGTPLVQGVDYRFTYQPTTDQILLTPQAGVWLPGSRYEIELINQDRFIIDTVPANLIPDGTTIRLTDERNVTQRFEFESGYTLEVPQPLTIQVPAGNSGLSAVADGDLFTIRNGARLTTFEFDSDGMFAAGRVRIVFQPSSTPNDVANAIVSAIEFASLGLAPANLGAGFVHVGGPTGTVLDTSLSALLQQGQAGAVLDGHGFTIEDSNQDVSFEFDNDGVVSSGAVPLPFTSNDTRNFMAQTVADVVADAAFATLSPLNVGNGRVHLGGTEDVSIVVDRGNMQVLGQPGFQSIGGGQLNPVVYVPSPTVLASDVAELLRVAIEQSSLQDVYSFVNESGDLAMLGITNVVGASNRFVEGIQDIAGNNLQTNRNEQPFEVRLRIDLPAPLDFGDAPDPPYATLLESNGARHVIVESVYLGAGISDELDANQNETATGDTFDDGIGFELPLAPGGSVPINVTASTDGLVSGWIDFDQDGTFDEVRDQVLRNAPVKRGANVLVLPIPTDAELGQTFARFRFSTAAVPLPTGRADNGEVEDYQVEIVDIAPPTAVDDEYDVDEDVELDVPAASGVLANDIDPSAGDLTAALVTDVTNGDLTFRPDGSFTYQPDPDYFGLDSFTYIALSDILSSQEATVTIRVAAVFDPPIAGDDEATTPEDTAVLIDLAANDFDPDGALDKTSIEIVADPANGEVSVNPDGTALYTPDTNFVGQDTFQYTIKDVGGTESNAATVTVTVENVNDRPVAVDDVIFTQQAIASTKDLIENDYDPDGEIDPQSIVITLSPKSGTVNVNGDGTVTFTPMLNFLGTDTFRYTVRDDEGALSNEAVVTVNVSDDNIPPIANDDADSTVEGQPVTINVIANDDDVDGMIIPGSVGVIEDPVNGLAVPNVDGTVTYTPNEGFVGIDTFRYVVRDEFNSVSNPATVTVTVLTEGPPWQNSENPLDVNADGVVIPFDALLVINAINNGGSRPLDPPPIDDPPFEPPPFIDVNGDNFLSPFDALLVINELNSPSQVVAARPATMTSPSLTDQQVIGAALDIEPRPQSIRHRPEAVEEVFSQTAPLRAEPVDPHVDALADEMHDRSDGERRTDDRSHGDLVDDELLDLLVTDL